jgi:hypothetical protein
MREEISILAPNDSLPSESEILNGIYVFVLENFHRFGHNKINGSKNWYTPSWSPFMKYYFYKLGKELEFTIGLKRGIQQFRTFFKRMEDEKREAEMHSDEDLKEYLTIDLSWRPPNAIIPDIPKSEIIYLAFEHEEDTDPKLIATNTSTYIGAQLDEVRKLGYVKSFIKILFIRPKYYGFEGKRKRLVEHERTLITEIEKELQRQYIEDHEMWLVISVTLDDIDSPSKIIFHGFKYNPQTKTLEIFDENRYIIEIDNTSDPVQILSNNCT